MAMQANYIHKSSNSNMKETPNTVLPNTITSSLIDSSYSSISSHDHDQMREINEGLKRQVETLTTQMKQTDGIKYRMEASVASDVKRKVKHDVFKQIKFIPNSYFLNDLSNPYSFGNVILNMYKIDAQDHLQWWNTYKETAKKALNTKRSNVNTAIQAEILAMHANKTEDAETGINVEKSNDTICDQQGKTHRTNNQDTIDENEIVTFPYSDDETSDDENEINNGTSNNKADKRFMINKNAPIMQIQGK